MQARFAINQARPSNVALPFFLFCIVAFAFSPISHSIFFPHRSPRLRRRGSLFWCVCFLIQGEVGNRWADIAKRLTGRTENAVKIRWKALNRRQRDARNRAAAAAAAVAAGTAPAGGSTSRASSSQRTGAREGTRAHGRAATRAAATPSTAPRGRPRETAAGRNATPAGGAKSTAQDSTASLAGVVRGRRTPVPGDHVASIAAAVQSGSPGAADRGGSAVSPPGTSFAAAGVVRDAKEGGEDRGLHRLCAALRNVEAMDSLQVAEDDATKDAAAFAAAERFRFRTVSRFRRKSSPAPFDAEGQLASGAYGAVGAVSAVDVSASSSPAVHAANTSDRPPPPPVPSAIPAEPRPYSVAPRESVQVVAEGAARDSPPAVLREARGGTGRSADPAAAPVVTVPVSKAAVPPVEPSPGKGPSPRGPLNVGVAEGRGGGGGSACSDSSPTRQSSLVAVAEGSRSAAAAATTAASAAAVVEESEAPITVAFKRSRDEKGGTEVVAAAVMSGGGGGSGAVTQPPAKKGRSPRPTLPPSPSPAAALPVPNPGREHVRD